MGRLARFAAMAAALLLAMVAPASAQSMAGTYHGTGDVTGTTLELTQQGNQVEGQFYGSYTGTLFGQIDAQKRVQGYLDENNIRYTFYGDWSPQGFAITLYDTAGNKETVTFAAEGAAPANGGPTPPPQPQPPAANYYTFDNGTQSGPFTLEEVLDRIKSGAVKRTTMVWQPGQPEWRPAQDLAELAGSLPPEPPKPARYFVVENGKQAGPLTLEEMIARIADGRTVGKDLVWKDGLEAWTAASELDEFDAALAPAPTPPPPPVSEPAPSEPSPPPPPPSQPPAAEPAPPPAPAPDAPPAPDQPAADDDQSVSTVTLMDGRNLVVIGGTEQSVSSVSGGYELVIDGTAISFVNGKLTVDGKETSVPDFKKALTIRYDNGSVAVSGE